MVLSFRLLPGRSSVKGIEKEKRQCKLLPAAMVSARNAGGALFPCVMECADCDQASVK